MTKLEHLRDLIYASYACISLLQKHAETLEERELCRHLLSDAGLPEGYVNINDLEHRLLNRSRTKKTIHGQS